VNLSLMVPSDTLPPVLGRMSLNLEATGAGRSPAALVGALSGSGSLVLYRAEIASLNPLAIDAAIDAADRGLAIDRERIGRLVTTALDGARLNVPLFNATIALNAGQLRISAPVTPAQSADTAITGSYDLSEDMLDLRVTLTGAPKPDAPNDRRPELTVAFRGKAAAPKRNVDVTALVDWLTMRAVNREAKRLEAIETATSSIPNAPLGTPPSSPAPAPSFAPNLATPPAPPTLEPVTPPAAGPAPAPPRAAAVPRTEPPAPETPAFERAPELPPPVDIRPVPGPGDRRATPRSQTQRPRPPAALGTAPEGRVRPPLDLSIGAQN
jgi:hypothetical protein